MRTSEIVNIAGYRYLTLFPLTNEKRDFYSELIGKYKEEYDRDEFKLLKSKSTGGYLLSMRIDDIEYEDIENLNESGQYLYGTGGNDGRQETSGPDKESSEASD